ncbi:zinc finger, CCHC-type containing protein [Tanacetum coccineum]|uniref:Zinc finger, CCHC-type containing protein n=1 Tax=Tanacetum coccineum TaxID=301880 RepID=A0ABQ5CJC5_9ASTR
MVGNTVKEMTMNFGKLDKFEGHDFRRWQKKMYFLLTTLKVVYVLTTPMLELLEDAIVEAIRIRAKWENDDYICKGHILNGMSDSLFDVYTNVESAKELWDSLESKYMAEDSSSKKFLVSNFNNYKMVDSRTVMEQYNELLRIIGQYTQHGLEMDESIYVSSIIDNDKGKGKEVGGPSVNMTEEGKNKHNNQNKGISIVVISRTEMLVVLERGLRTIPKTKVDAIAWWIDFGATTHVCKDRCWFKTYEPVEDGFVLYMGDDHFAPVYGKGSVVLEFSSGKSITLFNVLYVLKLRKNLISGPVLNKCGYKQVYESDKYILSKCSVFVGFDYYKNGMFMLNLNKVSDDSDSVYMSFSSTVVNFSLCHARLGHVHYKRMLEMSKDDLIPAIDENHDKYRGGEYHDPVFFQFIGIIHETTAPYTPQENGVAERKNKALKEMVNSMLSYSGLSEGFWGEAMLTACYLLNRVPNKRNKTTPYELWYKKRPNLSFLRVWGCRAVVRLPDPKRKTLGEKGIDCIFVGYAEHSKAYRFYVIEPNDSVSINSIIESRDAIFDENRFSSIPRPKDIIPNSDESQRDDHSDDVPSEIPEPRKGKRVRKAKSYGSDFQLYLVEGSRDQVGSQYSYCYSIEEDPRTYNEAMQSRDSAFWKEAIDDEIGSIMENNTWVLSDLPPGCKPLGCKWIFKRKMKVDGTIEKFKAQLVIQGFRQKEGIDYFDTYAPVARITTIRLLLALAAIHNLVIHQIDVKTAFLNSDLDEKVYMKQPERFVMPGVIICLYVDDMLIFGTDQNQVDKTKKFLSSKFSMKDMGEAYVILGIKIKRKNKRIVITQSHYIEKILKKFNREDCSPVSTPMDPVEKLKPNTGCIYSNLVERHCKAITRAYSRMLKEVDYELWFIILGYLRCRRLFGCSWINHAEDSSSTSGWVFLLGGGAITKRTTYVNMKFCRFKKLGLGFLYSNGLTGVKGVAPPCGVKGQCPLRGEGAEPLAGSTIYLVLQIDVFLKKKLYLSWDLDNFHVDLKIDAYIGVLSIKEGLLSYLPNITIARMNAYANTNISKVALEACHNNGFSVTSVPAGTANAADTSLIIDLFRLELEQPLIFVFTFPENAELIVRCF